MKKTVYTCDKCLRDAPMRSGSKEIDLWRVNLSVAYAGGNYLSHTATMAEAEWCRDCMIAAFGEAYLKADPAKPKVSYPVLSTTERLLVALNELIQESVAEAVQEKD